MRDYTSRPSGGRGGGIKPNLQPCKCNPFRPLTRARRSPLGLVYYLNVEGDEGRVTGMVTVHRLDKAYGMVRGKEEGVVEREREEVRENEDENPNLR